MQIVLSLEESDELKVGLVNMFISTILAKNCRWILLLSRADITQVSKASTAACVKN